MFWKHLAGLVLGLTVIVVSCRAANAAGLVVDFDSPRGGELYVVGQTQTVRLSAKTRAKSVEIEVSRDGGATFAALGTIDNTVKDKALRNILPFTVTGPASTNCVIRARTASGKSMATFLTGAFCIVVAPDAAALPAGSVGAAGLADGSVTTPKLADVAVTDAKIASQAVTQEKVGSGAASAGMLLTADGLGAASFAALNAASLTGTAGINITGNAMTAATANGVATMAGNSIVAALNNAGTTRNTLSADILTGTGAVNITGNAATATLAQGVADNAVTAAKIADGTVTPAKMAVYPAVRVRNGVDVPIPNNAFTALTFDTERFDTDNCHDAVNPSRLTCNTAGVYYICANVGIQPNATGTRALLLRVNGTVYIDGAYGPATPAPWGSAFSISTVYYLNVGDYVESVAYQNSGGVLNASAQGAPSEGCSILAMARLP